MMLNGFLLLLGLALLACGGEALIRGSLAAAKRLGVSPLLSGLVIGGFGTSAPELVVSVEAAQRRSNNNCMARVRLTEQAQSELDAIIEYYEQIGASDFAEVFEGG